MDNLVLVRHPFFVLPLSFLLMWLSAQIGIFFRNRRLDMGEDIHHDDDVIVSATLTLLALIIGFTFSMAIGRYDQRKDYEEAEANAIGTEYVRADLLPADDAARIRSLLKEYVEARVRYYETGNEHELQRINIHTEQLQSDLWSAVKTPAIARPSPVLSLAVAGMNDVINSQGYTQAGWWNRIPVGAWILMIVLAIWANLLVAYAARRAQGTLRLMFLPLILCVAFFLIADIDSPRKGVIRVLPQNLVSLARSLQGH
jgi:hypothetical protein